VRLTTATAAVALGISQKRLDNILARRPYALVASGRRGRSRKLSPHLLEHVAVAILLNRDLGTPLGDSIRLARSLIGGDGHHALGALGSLRFDLASLRHSLDDAIASALEETPTPRRGRPPIRRNDKRGAFK
jgi:hypothetical protein